MQEVPRLTSHTRCMPTHSSPVYVHYTVSISHYSQFANSLWELSLYFSDDAEIMAFLNKLIHALQEMNKFHTILLDQASRTVVKDLSSFMKW